MTITLTADTGICNDRGQKDMHPGTAKLLCKANNTVLAPAVVPFIAMRSQSAPKAIDKGQ